MGFMDAVKAFFSNYVKFSGRSSRSEYWWPQLFLFIVFFLLGLVIGMMGMGEGAANGIVGIAYLAVLLPAIAVAIRRLHDTDRSGWWILIGLIPIIGAIVLLIFYIQKGTDGPNRFGPDPLGNNADVFS